VQAEKPGELVCIDTFYIGNLKGVGKLWQLTACDAASSYAMAKVMPANNAKEAASFLKDVVAPEVEKAGWKLWRVLTDGGSEFKADFDQACRDLNVKHTRTKPRHAWTNGFVERLQGTILHEHWRIVFRRRYFRSAISYRYLLHPSSNSTTSSGLIRATVPRDGPPPRSSGAPSASTVKRRAEVSTPFRYWTP